ncbi:MAG: ACT domain-containing protein [Victivallaceae bacterium]|nr:ACT domain-containing protein [Victivallaceae bacterium]
MPITQLSLFVENRPGELGKVCRVLKDNNVNISTLSLADTQQFGILRLLVKETDKARKVLEAAGYVVKSTDVLAITVPDYPGGLADVLSILDKYSFQVEYMYAFTFGHGDRAVIVFRFENPARAIEVLRNEPVELLRADDLFK